MMLGAVVLAASACLPDGPSREVTLSRSQVKVYTERGAVLCGRRTGFALSGVGAGAAVVPVLIRHHHRLSGAYRLQSLRYWMNGGWLCEAPRARERFRGVKPPPMTTFHGGLPPGKYELRHVARYRGHGVGVFRYLSGYRFRTASAKLFDVRPRTPLCVDVIAAERSATSLRRRLAVRYRIIQGCSEAGRAVVAGLPLRRWWPSWSQRPSTNRSAP